MIRHSASHFFAGCLILMMGLPASAQFKSFSSPVEAFLTLCVDPMRMQQDPPTETLHPITATELDQIGQIGIGTTEFGFQFYAGPAGMIYLDTGDDDTCNLYSATRIGASAASDQLGEFLSSVEIEFRTDSTAQVRSHISSEWQRSVRFIAIGVQDDAFLMIAVNYFEADAPAKAILAMTSIRTHDLPVACRYWPEECN